MTQEEFNEYKNAHTTKKLKYIEMYVCHQFDLATPNDKVEILNFMKRRILNYSIVNEKST